MACAPKITRYRERKAALVGGVEAPDALDLVAEEIDAKTIFLPRGEEVEEAAAHRELALVGDGVDAVEAVRDEQFGKRIAVDPLPGLEARRELANPERGERALGDGGDRGKNKFAAPRRGLERR